jgi:signal transduction histidine kinase
VSYRFGVDEITVDGHLDPSLPSVEGDAIRLEQVVVNLLSNAIDALRMVTPPRRVMVDSWVENGTVCIAVTDNGRGVAQDVIERLFHPFATTKGTRGTGLGLYIVARLMQLAQGRVTAESAGVGQGACFVLTWPAAAVPRA